MELFKSDRLLVEGSFLQQKPALSEAGNFLVLVKYYEGNMRFNSVFAIYVIDFNTGYILESYDHYLCLFVDSINGFEITFYESFHNEFPDRKRKIELSEANFKKAGEILIKIDDNI